jgi:hypothetical protein
MPTRMAATRQELARSGKDLGLLLAMARAMDLQVPADHPLAIAFATLARSADSTSLPGGVN